LVVFACACLAALGLQVLGQRRLRIVVAIVGGAPGVAALAALLAIVPNWRGFLVADPARATAWIQSTYLATRAQYPIDPQLALTGLVTSLDITSVKTAWSLALLALKGVAFVAWLALGPRRVLAGQAVFVGLLAVDLLVFAFDFHPRAPLASLTPALGATAGQRVLMHDSADLPAFEPDQLLAEGFPTAGGYSSLPSQRHVELETATSSDPSLFDLWSAPLLLEPANPSDLRVVNGVRLRAQHPLAVGFGGSPPQTLLVPAATGPIAAIRVIGTLSYGFNAPQGEVVASLGVGTQTLPLRAGIEQSERAYDRPSLTGLVQHQKAADALDFEEATPEGEDYIAHLYQADLALATAASADSLVVTPSDPSV